MKTITYQIKFFSYWHCGSGLIGGTESNASVIKDKKGLPFVPGKTLKGLLRDAADSLLELDPGIFPPNFKQEVFGVEGRTYDSHSSFFSNGELSNSIKSRVSLADIPNMYHLLSSTAIDEQGQAKDKSLRTIEVSIPMPLYAEIQEFPTGVEYEASIEKCFQWIKRMGYNRSRGLGRCQLTLQK